MLEQNGPYQTVEDIYKLPKLSAEQKEIVKKYEKNLVALEPAPEVRLLSTREMSPPCLLHVE